MARIPTYTRQVTQVTAPREYHTDSAISAAISGAVSGIGQAQNLVRSVSAYQQVQKAEAKAEETEAYQLNELEKNKRIKDDAFGLNEANIKIRNELANTPNYKVANEKLLKKYNELSNNIPEDMDERSVKEWKNALYNMYDNLRTNNLKWSESETKRLAAQSKKDLADGLHEMTLDSMRNAGYLHQPAKMFNLSLNNDGSVADDYVAPRDKAEKANQNEGTTEFISQYLQSPLVAPEQGNGIFFDLRTIEEEKPKKFLGFTVEKGKTQRDNGIKQIDEFFDKELEVIQNHPALDEQSKSYLESLASTQKKKRIAEFDEYMNAQSHILQKKAGREPTLENTIDYLNSIAGKPQMSFIDGKEQKLIPTRDFTPILGTNEDISYRYSTAPVGGVESFDIVLSDALEQGRFPTGKWNVSEIYKRYAPNGTIQETQALEALMQGSPDLELTGNTIENMKTENGFNEFEWAHQTVSDIASMPENTDEEKIRKTAAANHALYQANKEVNGGQGFRDRNLQNFFDASLKGIAENNYMPLISDENLDDMFSRVKARSMTVVGSSESQKAEQAIYSEGLSKAIDSYKQTQDKDQLKEDIRQIDKRVLKYRYRGIINLDDLEKNLQDGKPAIFTYHTVPYKYLGFSGDDIYVEVGGIKQKMGL